MLHSFVSTGFETRGWPDRPLFEAVSAWLERAWPFERVLYAAR